MAYPLLLLDSRLGECLSQLVGKKVRIVTEAALATGMIEYDAARCPATGKLGGAIDKRGNTHVASAPIRHVRERLEQSSVVRRVQRDSNQIGSRTPALAADSRLAAQCVDFESRVISDDGPLRTPREVPRLGEGVLLEGVGILQVVLRRRRVNTSLGEIHHGNSRGAEQLAKLSKLAAATSRNEQRLNRHRERALDCSASISPSPRTARFSISSRSSRAKVPCSPVPCTSTNRPSLLMITFMSTAATTSSA